MKNILLQTALFCLISFAPLFIKNAAAGEGMKALAMHGNPKYGEDFTHLEYANPQAPKGGTLKQAAIGTFDSLNPFALKGKAAEGMTLFYDRLMQRVWDEPFTMYPLIAEKVDVPEDRSSITIHINPKARFHDGTAVTAEDVLFSFETLKVNGRANTRAIYKLVDETKIIDDRTVYFHFGEGHDRETVMILTLMPVLSKAWWEGREFDASTLEIPNSSGPYKIKNVDPGRKIVYERDPDYWGKDLPVNVGHYNFDTVIYEYYRDDSVALEAFKSGNLDLRREGDAGKWASHYDFPAIQSGKIKKEAITHSRPEKVKSLIFNTRRAPFDHLKVREALTYVLDFDWLNKNLYHGLYSRVDSYFPNAPLAARGKPSAAELALLEPYRTELPESVFTGVTPPPSSADQRQKRKNLRKADELLKQAGWIVQDGKRVKADTPSQQFTFEIMIDSPVDEKLVLSFIGDLQRLGIAANIRVLDTAAFRRRLNEYDFDMMLYHWTNSLSPGTEQMRYWSCESADNAVNLNYPGVCNPAIDALTKGISNAQTYDELTTYAHALDRVLLANHYIIPLYYRNADYVAYAKDIQRPQDTPIYGMVIETWWADTQNKTQ